MTYDQQCSNELFLNFFNGVAYLDIEQTNMECFMLPSVQKSHRSLYPPCAVVAFLEHILFERAHGAQPNLGQD